MKPRSPTLQADFLPAEPPGKPKDTEVGSLSLLQGIFPTQELGSSALQADSLPTDLWGKPVLRASQSTANQISNFTPGPMPRLGSKVVWWAEWGSEMWQAGWLCAEQATSPPQVPQVGQETAACPAALLYVTHKSATVSRIRSSLYYLTLPLYVVIILTFVFLLCIHQLYISNPIVFNLFLLEVSVLTWWLGFVLSF